MVNRKVDGNELVHTIYTHLSSKIRRQKRKDTKKVSVRTETGQGMDMFGGDWRVEALEK